MTSSILERIPVMQRENLEYFRPEKNGYVTIRSAIHPETNEIVMNRTAAQIMDLCDGTRSVGGVLGALMEIYPKAPADRVEQDLHAILSSLTRLRVMSWAGGNPYHNPFVTDLGEGYNARLLSEDDLDLIVQTLKTVGVTEDSPSAEYRVWMSPLLTPGSFTKENISQFIFSRLEFYTVLERSGTVVGLICLRSPYTYGSKVGSVQMFVLERPCGLAAPFLQYALDLLPQVLLVKATGIRVSRECSCEWEPVLFDALQEAGFVSEMLLPDEFGPGQHLEVLRYSFGEA